MNKKETIRRSNYKYDLLKEINETENNLDKLIRYEKVVKCQKKLVDLKHKTVNLKINNNSFYKKITKYANKLDNLL